MAPLLLAPEPGERVLVMERPEPRRPADDRTAGHTARPQTTAGVEQIAADSGPGPGGTYAREMALLRAALARSAVTPVLLAAVPGERVLVMERPEHRRPAGDRTAGPPGALAAPADHRKGSNRSPPTPPTPAPAVRTPARWSRCSWPHGTGPP
ncbi:hypothetical protein [Streptomyces virginiae]|uniref:hypothetical protein n=1 Tax=Streptomyces virginiae TaxID=1961 RepID=UPI003425CEF5